MRGSEVRCEFTGAALIPELSTAMRRLLLFLSLSCFAVAGRGQGVLINELQPACQRSLSTPEGDHPDWVELIGTGPRTIDLKGHSLSLGTKHHRFTSTLALAPNQHLLLFFDGHPERGVTHVDLKLAREGFYNGTLFHRVIKSFMIQGGDPNSKNAKPGEMLGNGDVGYTIPAEFNDSLFHKKGALAAARDNNPAKASSGCQFYIVQGKPSNDNELNSYEMRTGHKYPDNQRQVYKTLGGTPFLDQNYTVFGEVVEGLDVIGKIASVPKDGMDRPLTDVKMTVRVIE